MDSAKKVIAEFDMQVKEIPASTHLLIASKGNTSYQLAYRNGSLVFLQKLASGSLASGAFEQAISYDLVLQCRESK